MSRIPAPRQPRHGDGRWETVIRYALGSNARTFRFCAILLAAAVAYHATGLNVIELLRHMLLHRARVTAIKARGSRLAVRVASVTTPSAGDGGHAPHVDPRGRAGEPGLLR